MFAPTANPRLEGSVQGVVVQAKKKTSPKPSRVVGTGSPKERALFAASNKN